MSKEVEVKQRYERIARDLTERTRRLFAANEALSLGWGGISVVSRATGLSRQVISAGMQELQGGKRAEEGRVRRKGGGRKSNVSKDPRLREDLERMLEPVTRGDPDSPLRWTSKSVRKLAKALQGMSHQVSHELVSELLHALGYSLQSNRKTREGGKQPDRNGQFEHRNRASRRVPGSKGAGGVGRREKARTGGRFKNPGQEWHPQGAAEDVRVYDFPISGLGRATPYGCTTWDATRAGSMWALTTLPRRLPWRACAVGGTRWASGSMRRQNDCSSVPMEVGATARGCACGSGNCKGWPMRRDWPSGCATCRLAPCLWNTIEHRLFAWISQNWRGKPLTSYAVILQLIAATATEAGLTVQCQLDTKSYPAGRKVSDARDGDALHLAGCLPRRMELHDLASSSLDVTIVCTGNT